MNNRPELLTGMRELLEERRHQVVTDAQTVNPVLNGGLEMPVEVTMDLTGVEDGREVSVSYSSCEEKGCRKGKAVLRACGKTFLFRALMTLVRELERKGTDDSFEKKETVYLDKKRYHAGLFQKQCTQCGNDKEVYPYPGSAGHEYHDALHRGYL